MWYSTDSMLAHAPEGRYAHRMFLHIYLLRHGETALYKVGKSCQPSRRRKELQTGNPLKLSEVASFPGEAEMERFLHRAFELRGLKVTEGGEEWFTFPDDLTATCEVKKMCLRYEELRKAHPTHKGSALATLAEIYLRRDSAA